MSPFFRVTWADVSGLLPCSLPVRADMNGLAYREENWLLERKIIIFFNQDSNLLDTVMGMSPRNLHFPENK